MIDVTVKLQWLSRQSEVWGPSLQKKVVLITGYCGIDFDIVRISGYPNLFWKLFLDFEPEGIEINIKKKIECGEILRFLCLYFSANHQSQISLEGLEVRIWLIWLQLRGGMIKGNRRHCYIPISQSFDLPRSFISALNPESFYTWTIWLSLIYNTYVDCRRIIRQSRKLISP